MSILKVDTLQPATASSFHAAGHIIQVVTLTTGVTNATTTYADTGVTATITPKFATSSYFS